MCRGGARALPATRLRRVDDEGIAVVLLRRDEQFQEATALRRFAPRRHTIRQRLKTRMQHLADGLGCVNEPTKGVNKFKTIHEGNSGKIATYLNTFSKRDPPE